MNYEEIKEKVDKKIGKNRAVLKTLNIEGKTLVRKKEADKLGFDPRYYTNVFRTTTGNEYKLCYDVGFKELELTDELLIIDTQDYMV